MEAFLPATATRVLEVGCGPGGFAAVLRKKYSSATLIAAEPSAQSNLARSEGYDHVVESPFPGPWLEDFTPFDLIIFNDVLEHMIDPWGALRVAHIWLRPGGRVVASIPNVRHYTVIRNLILKGRWDYKAQGILDNTHLRFFTRATTTELFTGAGFRLTKLAPATFSSGRTDRLLRFGGSLLRDFRVIQYGICAQKISDIDIV